MENLGKTSTGLEANVAAALSYLGGFVTGIIFLLVEKDNRFVRFHAMQSIIVFGGFCVLEVAFSFMPFIERLMPLLGLAAVVLWIVCMVKSYQGEKFKLPLVGDLAEQKI